MHRWKVVVDRRKHRRPSWWRDTYYFGKSPAHILYFLIAVAAVLGIYLVTGVEPGGKGDPINFDSFR